MANAPTTLGGPVSLRLTCPAAGRMVLDVEGPAEPTDIVARFPTPGPITAVRVNDKPVQADGATLTLPKARGRARIEVEFAN